MEKFWILILGVLAIVIWSKCTNVKVSKESEYNGMKVLLTYKNVKGFSSNQITYYIQLGKFPKIPIDAFTTDLYGAPYSERVFGDAPHHFFRKDSALYSAKIDFHKKFTPTMLYFDPVTYSKEHFDAYTDFFNNGWPDVVKEINKEYLTFTKDIVGVVYGKKEDFVQYFSGEYNSASHYFEIQAEGAIYFRKGVPPDNSGFQGSGLLPKVQMPGYKIILADTSLFTPQTIKTFIDKEGKTMADYFTIEVMTNQNNEQ